MRNCFFLDINANFIYVSRDTRLRSRMVHRGLLHAEKAKRVFVEAGLPCSLQLCDTQASSKLASLVGGSSYQFTLNSQLLWLFGGRLSPKILQLIHRDTMVTTACLYPWCLYIPNRSRLKLFGRGYILGRQLFSRC